MATRLVCLLCLLGNVLSQTPPDVDCLVLHLKHVQCSWAKAGTPDVNYTFSSRFTNGGPEAECPSYLTENNVVTGCKQPYKDTDRFHIFHTTLRHANRNFTIKHDLKSKVLLNPPTNLTVIFGADANLWYYWNQTAQSCVQSQVRYRINSGKWTETRTSTGRQSFCINLPFGSNQYELQVRSKVDSSCGGSQFWSNWSEPVIWASNNSTDARGNPMAVWTPVLYVVGGFVLILSLLIVLQHERFRVILIPIVPKPSLVPNEIEDWFKISKDGRERFKTNYNERACSVCEYFPVSRSNSFTSSVSTNQTNRPVSMSEDTPEDPPSPTAAHTENEQHASVLEESAAFVES